MLHIFVWMNLIVKNFRELFVAVQPLLCIRQKGASALLDVDASGKRLTTVCHPSVVKTVVDLSSCIRCLSPFTQVSQVNCWQMMFGALVCGSARAWTLRDLQLWDHAFVFECQNQVYRRKHPLGVSFCVVHRVLGSPLTDGRVCAAANWLIAEHKDFVVGHAVLRSLDPVSFVSGCQLVFTTKYALRQRVVIVGSGIICATENDLANKWELALVVCERLLQMLSKMVLLVSCSCFVLVFTVQHRTPTWKFPFVGLTQNGERNCRLSLRVCGANYLIGDKENLFAFLMGWSD